MRGILERLEDDVVIWLRDPLGRVEAYVLEGRGVAADEVGIPPQRGEVQGLETGFWF